MQTRPWRITSAQAKVGYVVGGVVVGVLLLLLLWAVGVPDGVAPLVGSLWSLAVVVVGVRVFRGPGEPVDPRRAWWRMTAGPVVGYLLAVYFAADVVFARGLRTSSVDVGGLVTSAVVALAYAASATVLVVLRVQGRPAPGSVRAEDPRGSGSTPAHG